MADDNVVSIKGRPIVPPGTPDPEVIECAEKLVALASSGEISGFVYVALFRDESTSYHRIGRLTRAVIGAIELLKVSLCQDDIEDK